MKTLLITGASGNLGKTVVEYLHQKGYNILATLVAEHEVGMFDYLPEINAQVVDVLDVERVNEFLESPESADIEAAILLVGGFAMGKFSDTDVAFLQKMYQLNFLSAFNMVKPLMEKFEADGGGQFILVGARPALNPDDGKNMVAYALSKSLVFSLAELINAEGKNSHITASVIVPSTIDTPANRSAMPDDDPENWVPPQNLAELIEFLLSETGSMTRQTVIKLYNNA